jgi:hypothetical protein
LKEDYFDFDTWITAEQDQDQYQMQAQMPAEIQGQDTRPQKRRYSSEALDSTDPSTERRYPLRKRQLTVKAAALIIE